MASYGRTQAAGDTTASIVSVLAARVRTLLVRSASRALILRAIVTRFDRANEVFPWIDVTLISGVLGGLILSVGLLDPGETNVLRILTRVVLVSVGGGCAGIFLGMMLAAPHSRPRGTQAAPRDEVLWDSWLDEQPRVEVISEEPRRMPRESETLPSVEPLAEALVRPRVLTRELGQALPLGDEIWPLIQRRAHGAVRIWGGPGSGKSTALRHVASMIPPLVPVKVLDEPDAATASLAAVEGLLIYSAPSALTPHELASYQLAPWGEDELIEYLLARHRDRCASVMGRLRETDDSNLPDGIPELWTIVLDAMARDESIASVRDALKSEFTRLVSSQDLRSLMERVGLDIALAADPEPLEIRERLSRHRHPQFPFHLVLHRPVQVLLAADYIAEELEQGRECKFLRSHFPLDLLRAAARRIAADQALGFHLQTITEDNDSARQSMAVSLLHAAGLTWTPRSGRLVDLYRAYLMEVHWAGVDLRQFNMAEADLSSADLAHADLRFALVGRGCFQNAQLEGADLRGIRAAEANFRGACLALIRGVEAQFLKANLAEANLEKADLWKANLTEADLRGACFREADLTQACLCGANIEGADFTGARLHSANLMRLPLRRAVLDGADFEDANLVGGDLEGVELPNANFTDATLRRANLTGARMPRANFLGADLSGAWLADVDWSGASLRDANLRYANFHMGSSRSGLVGSPIASEGSRTGFYTDDYHDRHSTPPEEIRKANLRGADLRGANIENVDFYLVDLRDALFTSDQARVFRRSGAILSSEHQ